MILFFLYPFLLFFVVHGFDRNEIQIILISSVILGLYFFYLEKRLQFFKNRFRSFFVYSIILRCFALGSDPNFSDDIFRYLFDAKLILNGFSPYQLTPSEWILIQPLDSIELKEIFSKMNSPNYYTVYPIFLLFFYMIGSLLNLIFHSNFLGVQFVFLTIDVLNLYLIRRFYPKESNSFYWVYYANPLIIIEGISQMHPEILLVPWILLIVKTKNIWKRGLFLLFLTQLKINTVLFMFGVSKNRKKILYLAIGIVFFFILWKLTVFSNLETQGERGIGLFFHSFRFAGIFEPFFYYPFSFFGITYLSGLVSLVVCGVLLCFLFLNRTYMSLSIEKRMFLLYGLFLFFSPVIHPWYWIVFFILGMVSRISINLISYIIFLAFLSYLIYVSDIFFYIYWVLFLLGIGLYGSKEINHLRQTT
ncbi:hypothetical protein AB3N60_13000 [Leptospira sp. WS39.C2]